MENQTARIYTAQYKQTYPKETIFSVLGKKEGNARNRGERGGGPPAANGESGTLAGDDGTELDSPDGTASDGGRAIVMLRVTAGAAAATAVDEEDEGEKEEYLRSLPSP